MSKWIKDFIIKPDILNLIEEKVGNSIKLRGTGEFINRTLLAQALRSTINKWDLMKQKSFCKAIYLVIWTKQQPIEWEKIFINSIFNKG